MYKDYLITSRMLLRETKNIKVPYIHICISDPGIKLPKLPNNPNRIATLFVQFEDDLWDDPIKENDFYKIVEFTEKYKNVAEIIVINCEFGQSRSAGVMAGLCKIYNLDDRDCFFGLTGGLHRYPSKLCYNGIIDAYNSLKEKK